MSLVVELNNLLKYDNGTKPHITKNDEPAEAAEQFRIQARANNLSVSNRGFKLREDFLGTDIWLPVRLIDVPVDKRGTTGEFYLPYSVVRITASSTIVKTPLVERRGSVKELYSIDDYKISIKGFFIDKANRIWPEEDIYKLKLLHENGQAFGIENALASLFLDTDDRVVVTGFELPEVEGGRKHVRPFSITLESDSVFTLEVE